jgi:hypothetical protein
VEPRGEGTAIYPASPAGWRESPCFVCPDEAAAIGRTSRCDEFPGFSSKQSVGRYTEEAVCEDDNNSARFSRSLFRRTVPLAECVWLARAAGH